MYLTAILKLRLHSGFLNKMSAGRQLVHCHSVKRLYFLEVIPSCRRRSVSVHGSLKIRGWTISVNAFSSIFKFRWNFVIIWSKSHNLWLCFCYTCWWSVDNITFFSAWNWTLQIPKAGSNLWLIKEFIVLDVICYITLGTETGSEWTGNISISNHFSLWSMVKVSDFRKITVNIHVIEIFKRSISFFKYVFLLYSILCEDTAY